MLICAAVALWEFAHDKQKQVSKYRHKARRSVIWQEIWHLTRRSCTKEAFCIFTAASHRKKTLMKSTISYYALNQESHYLEEEDYFSILRPFGKH